MIPYGPWRPDAAGINTPVCRSAVNVLPGVVGFKPLPSLDAASAALPDTCIGAAVTLEADGEVHAFAGTAEGLYKLASGATWDDVTNTGGAYATGAGERWRFAVYGDLVLATTIAEPLQKFDVTSSTEFEDLGGSPPKARYVDVVRDFVLLGCIENNERRVQWSAINNAEGWTPGTASSDYQDMPSGGPVRGLIGGEVAYVWQASKVTRMTFVPGSAEVFQFDEVEGGRGLAAPHSLVRLGRLAYYLATDGFYQFDLGSGASKPLGVGKWSGWVVNDIRAGSESLVVGGIDPARQVVMWAYVPQNSAGSSPSRMLIYDWSIDEATIADVPIDSMAQWLTQGMTLDDLGTIATLDELPFSLDSPVWRGGAGLMGVFSTSNTLSHFAGPAMEAVIESSDGQGEGRTFVRGTRPAIDTSNVTVAIAARERDADTVTFGADEAMETTGVCPAHISGNLIRARVTVAEAAVWTLAKGIATDVGRQGKR